MSNRNTPSNEGADSARKGALLKRRTSREASEERQATSRQMVDTAWALVQEVVRGETPPVVAATALKGIMVIQKQVELEARYAGKGRMLELGSGE